MLRRFKISYIKPSGRMFCRYIAAASRAAAVAQVSYVLLGVYEVNEVNAIIG
jgi:hypothetical protein